MMHGILSWLLRDRWGGDNTDLAHFDLVANAKLCEKNFCEGLETYKTLTVPTLENIQTLILGVISSVSLLLRCIKN